MSHTYYPCTYPNCDKIFSKAFELKKHKVAHDNPDRVFYCSECSFITLQKKNLGIHFAIHTGKKVHQCPDTINVVDSVGSPAREGRCEYRTNDPAALTKHRKRTHGYVPPANRSRSAKKGAPATPRKTRKTKDKNVSRHPLPFQRPHPASCPKPSLAPEMLNNAWSGAGDTFTSPAAPEDPSRFLWHGNVDSYGQSMDPYSSNVSGCDPSVSSSAMLTVPEDEMELNALYDPSLHSEWMAKYEMSYSTFDTTGTTYLPEPHPAAPPSEPGILDVQTDQWGCLCPQWMVETGIEGWNQSVLDPHRQFYALDA